MSRLEVRSEPPRGSPRPDHAMAASDPGQVDGALGLVREQDHLTLLATWQGFVVAPVTGQLDCAGRHGRAGPLNSDLRALRACQPEMGDAAGYRYPRFLVGSERDQHGGFLYSRVRRR